jgi:hypothetical protein
MASTFTLPAASPEQLEVVESLLGHNLIVDSVAGSGKTTTVLHAAVRYPEKHILMLTYNARLRLETQARVQSLGLSNLTVHTYHSLGYSYIGSECRTDRGLIEFCKTSARLQVPHDILIVDECQDMTRVYHDLVTRVITPETRLCIIGDKFQSIYGYSGADPRFITLADHIYKISPWKRLNLSTSYRITRPMADFINTCVLAQDRLGAVKDGPRVQYHLYNPFAPENIVEDIKRLLADYSPSDIFVLAPSVKSDNPNSPVRKLVNALAQANILVYVPTSEQGKLDETVTKNKVVFSSFHQSKGLERRVVLVLNFDASYFTYYGRDLPDDRCPNVLYVALTRASERLIIYHNQQNNPMSFIDLEQVRAYADVRGELVSDITATHTPTKTNVTKLAEHLPSDVVEECMSLLKITELRAAAEAMSAQTKIRETDANGVVYYEEVSDITGLAVTFYYEFRRHGKIVEVGRCARVELGDYLVDGELHARELMRLTIDYLSYTTGFLHRKIQIKTYDWISQAQLQTIYETMREEMDSEQFEFEREVSSDISRVRVVGRMDALSDSRIIECKFVGELTPEHYLQLVIYGYLYQKSAGPKALHLFNIKTNHLSRVECSDDHIHAIALTLLCNRYHAKPTTSDEQFLRALGASETHMGRKKTCNECM